MSKPEHLLVVNAYGDVIPTAKVKRLKREHPTVRVSAPGYIERTIVLDFKPEEPDLVLLWMDVRTAKGPGLEIACERNLYAAAHAATLNGNVVSDYFSDYGMRAVKRQQDRCYFDLFDGVTFAREADRTGAFRRVPSGLHVPHEEGFEVVGSWKTTRGAPDLQVTSWRRGDEWVAELDLDLAGGLKHLGEVLGNWAKQEKTHPYDANQMMAWNHGVISFRLQPGA